MPGVCPGFPALALPVARGALASILPFLLFLSLLLDFLNELLVILLGKSKRKDELGPEVEGPAETLLAFPQQLQRSHEDACGKQGEGRWRGSSPWSSTGKQPQPAHGLPQQSRAWAVHSEGKQSSLRV